MTRDQKVVAIGAASGVAAMIAAVTGIYQTWPSSLAFVDLSSRLAYALEANVFAALPLLAGIILSAMIALSARPLIRHSGKKISRRRLMDALWRIRCSSLSYFSSLPWLLA